MTCHSVTLTQAALSPEFLWVMTVRCSFVGKMLAEMNSKQLANMLAEQVAKEDLWRSLELSDYHASVSSFTISSTEQSLMYNLLSIGAAVWYHKWAEIGFRFRIQVSTWVVIFRSGKLSASKSRPVNKFAQTVENVLDFVTGVYTD